MPDFQEDAFVLYTNFNRSKIEGKTDEFWSKSEWSKEEIEKLYKWSKEAPTVKNNRGDDCVVVNQKLLPRTAKTSGNPYLLGVTSGKQGERLPF